MSLTKTDYGRKTPGRIGNMVENTRNPISFIESAPLYALLMDFLQICTYINILSCIYYDISKICMSTMPAFPFLGQKQRFFGPSDNVCGSTCRVCLYRVLVHYYSTARITQTW